MYEVTKNYIDPITGALVIGGKMEVKEGAEVTGLTETAAAASAEALGGIKAAEKGAGDTVECKIDPVTEKLFAPTYPMLAAAGTELGGVKAAEKGVGDTVECKIDPTTKKLFAPTYPLVPAAANQAASTAVDVPALVVDLNALLTKLKAAGLMAADA